MKDGKCKKDFPKSFKETTKEKVKMVIQYTNAETMVERLCEVCEGQNGGG